MESSAVVRTDRSARSLVDPVRRGILLQLVQPDSAAGVARRTGVPRQKVNYHLRELESAGLVRLVEERRKGNCTERIVQSTASMYIISPEVLGELAADPDRIGERVSEAYLVALAARAIRELAVLRERADAVGKAVQTLSLSADVAFASQRDLNAFSEGLTNALAELTAKHSRSGPASRTYRFILGAYPAVTKTEQEAKLEASNAATSKNRHTPGAKP